jgi:hypothetical protein
VDQQESKISTTGHRVKIEKIKRKQKFRSTYKEKMNYVQLREKMMKRKKV